MSNQGVNPKFATCSPMTIVEIKLAYVVYHDDKPPQGHTANDDSLRSDFKFVFDAPTNAKAYRDFANHVFDEALSSNDVRAVAMRKLLDSEKVLVEALVTIEDRYNVAGVRAGVSRDV